MIQAMYSGISGMKAFKSNLDVIGNNVANVNTVGYKSGSVTFKEMLSQTMQGATGPSGTRGGSNPSQVGLGVSIGSIDLDMTQGPMQATGRQTDLAIEGNGYFALGDGANVRFTRDGAFSLDGQNNLVAGNGLRVLGWTADLSSGTIDTSAPITGASGIRIPVGDMSLARETSEVRVGGNLNAIAAEGKEYPIEFDVYDSLGVTHKMRIVFTKAGSGSVPPAVDPTEWRYAVHCDDVDAMAAVPGGTGSITFDAEGHSKLSSVPLALALATPNGSNTPITVNFDMSEMSQLNGQDTANMTYQDGLPLGTLEAYGIDRNGVVIGTFTNGSSRQLGQIAMAGFSNPAGLLKLGNNMLAVSANSGAPILGLPGEGGLGVINARFLEGSNVDLAKEFASMIVAQRGFQANSRMISVSDEVLQELVTLKR